MKFDDFYNSIKDFELKQYSSLTQADQYKYLFNILLDMKDNCDTSLDWGGGQGHMSAMLSYLGYQNTLLSIIDYSDKWKELGKINFFDWKHFDESVVDIPFENESFSLAVSCGVLEHVKETGGSDVKSLKEINRILKKNGSFVIYHLPNKYSWIEFLAGFFKKDAHEFKYSFKSFVNILQESNTNFKIKKHFRYGILPRRSAKKIKNQYLRKLYDSLDKFFEKTPLVYLSQNHCFVLEKSFD